MNETKRKLIAGIAVMLALALLVIVGNDEAELEQKAYCNNVGAGVWPDYNGTYKVECGGKDPPKFDENLTK